MRRCLLCWLFAGILASAASLALAQDTGQICVLAFVDNDEDGQRAEDEAPISRGIAASLLDESGVTIRSQLMEDSPAAVDGLLCFDELLAGEYWVVASSSAYFATSANEVEASVVPGAPPARIDIGFKSLAVATSPGIVTDLALLDEETLRTLTLAGGVVFALIIVLSMIGCLGVFALLRRRRRMRSRRRDTIDERMPARPRPDEEPALAPMPTKDPRHGSPPLFSDKDQDW